MQLWQSLGSVCSWEKAAQECPFRYLVKSSVFLEQMVYIVGSVTGYFISIFESALLFPLVGILRSDLNTHYIFSRYRPRSTIVLENRETENIWQTLKFYCPKSLVIKDVNAAGGCKKKRDIFLSCSTWKYWEWGSLPSVHLLQKWKIVIHLLPCLSIKRSIG